MAIEIKPLELREDIIAKLKEVHRSIYRSDPSKPHLYADRSEFLRVQDLLEQAIDSLCNPTEPREKRFTLTFSLEGEEFQVSRNRMNTQRIQELLGQVTGYLVTSRNTVPLFTDKNGKVFGELRLSWRNEKPK